MLWFPKREQIRLSEQKGSESLCSETCTIFYCIKRLTYDRAVDCEPVISPTGDQILFTSNRGGTRDLYYIEKRNCIYDTKTSDTSLIL